MTGDVPGERQSARGAVTPGAIVAAVLLPPLGLHLAAAAPRAFWMGTALTVVGYLPGLLFALYVLTLRRRPPAAA